MEVARRPAVSGLDSLHVPWTRATHFALQEAPRRPSSCVLETEYFIMLCYEQCVCVTETHGCFTISNHPCVATVSAVLYVLHVYVIVQLPFGPLHTECCLRSSASRYSMQAIVYCTGML